MYVPPWTIFAGLGALERRDLCNLIASFEATTLLSMSIDQLKNVSARLRTGGRESEMNAFARRMKETADKLRESPISDRSL